MFLMRVLCGVYALFPWLSYLFACVIARRLEFWRFPVRHVAWDWHTGKNCAEKTTSQGTLTWQTSTLTINSPDSDINNLPQAFFLGLDKVRFIQMFTTYRKINLRIWWWFISKCLNEKQCLWFCFSFRHYVIFVGVLINTRDTSQVSRGSKIKRILSSGVVVSFVFSFSSHAHCLLTTTSRRLVPSTAAMNTGLKTEQPRLCLRPHRWAARTSQGQE